ncbi:alkaline phosphatase family protein [Streptomyces sp. NPDC006365]|uniref:alkaline phosphatase family protein n=1 Tax=Streptomyces sp. NPDC006365 TaxID=3364744 RepID=UPI0036B6BE97
MLAALLPTASCGIAGAHTPRPDHIVVVIEENHGYADIIGNPRAPYINDLARRGASLTDFYGITHPSQPNYLGLFSGNSQDVVRDSCPHNFWQRPNLASKLLEADLTFVGYAQSLPDVGFTGCRHGAYVRRHNPWVNFEPLPSSINRPWTSFPRDFTKLPTVSFVVPDLEHNMHDGSVEKADTWLRDNLNSYARWAVTHNSVLVVTWDEAREDRQANRIPTVLVGEQVEPGNHEQPNNLYGLLRTLLDAYDLDPIGHSEEAEPIDVWKDDS